MGKSLSQTHTNFVMKDNSNMYTGKVRITPVCVGKSLIELVEYTTKEDNPTYEWKRYVLLQTATDTLDNPHVCVEKLLIRRTVFQVKG